VTIAVVSAFFDNREAAEKAMHELRRAGVRDAAMSSEARKDARHQDGPGPGNQDSGVNGTGFFVSVDTDLTAIGPSAVVEILYKNGGHSTSAPATE
jgi:hypothetical protein